jgi:hypothetical protein
MAQLKEIGGVPVAGAGSIGIGIARSFAAADIDDQSSEDLTLTPQLARTSP